MKRLMNKISVVIFLIFLFIPLLKTNFPGGGMSMIENRALAPAPKKFDLKSENRIAVENWINDHIGGRTSVLRLLQRVDYDFFDLVPNCIVGKDGWLFYPFAVDAHINSTYPNEDETLTISKKAVEITSKYEAEGRTLLISSFPQKTWIYGEYMPDTTKRINEKSQFEMNDEFLTNTVGVNYVSVYNELLNEKEKRLVYCRASDSSHWNNLGAFVAYQKIMEKAALSNPDLRVLNESDFNISAKEYTTNLPCGFKETEIDNEYILKNNQAVSNRELLKAIDFEGTDMWQASNAFQNKDESLPKAVICGDSYTWMYLLDEYSQSFSQLYFINIEDAGRMDEIVQKVDAEFVFIFGLGENMPRIILSQ